MYITSFTTAAAATSTSSSTTTSTTTTTAFTTTTTTIPTTTYTTTTTYTGINIVSHGRTARGSASRRHFRRKKAARGVSQN